MSVWNDTLQVRKWLLETRPEPGIPGRKQLIEQTIGSARDQGSSIAPAPATLHERIALTETMMCSNRGMRKGQCER